MGAWLLKADDRRDVERYLRANGFASNAMLPVTIERAGAGNMNLALRITPIHGDSFVLKQGRPWVEKYAHIPAPFDRTLVEAAFYRVAAGEAAVAAGMPALLHVDTDNHVLLLEDVGSGGDWTTIYHGEPLPQAVVDHLLNWLEALGGLAVDADARATFQNHAMRALNHEHIFDLPLRPDNGLALDDISSGLGAAARDLIADRAYCGAVSRLGRRYLADGEALVHGDYFPGSWLRTADGVRIIDPEFCFMGDPEFDYGVMAAHLTLAGAAAPLESIADAVEQRHLDAGLVAQYAGVEIMRRLIGVAQLPLSMGIDQKRMLLTRSRRLILEPERGLA